jgi:hypothetical protein
MAKFFSKTTKLLASAAFVTVVSTSGASALSLKFDGWENGYKTVNVTAPTHNGAAGAFKMKDVNTLDKFTVFCLDLLALIRSNTAYGYKTTTTPFSNSVDLVANGGLSRIQSIFDSGYAAALTSSTASAGFQVALWNAVYDTDWSVSNNAGAFFQSDTASGVQAEANAVLLAAENYSGRKKWNLTFFESTQTNPRSQNLVTAAPAPVPLPAAGLMLITALGGLFVGRRRKAA